MAHPHHEHRQSKVEHRRVAHITKHYASGGGVHGDEAEDKKLIKKEVKKSALKVHGKKPKHRMDKRARGGGIGAEHKDRDPAKRYERDGRGKNPIGETERTYRAKGGRTKHKGGTTNVNVIVPSGHQMGGAPMMPQGPAPAPRPPMAGPPAMPPGGAPGAAPPAAMGARPPMAPGMMPPRRAGGRTYAKGGAVKDGPAWEEGKKTGTQVQHAPGKNDGADVGRGKPITYAKGGSVSGKRLVSFYASGGPIEAPEDGKGMGPKMEGSARGGIGRLEKIHDYEHHSKVG